MRIGLLSVALAAVSGDRIETPASREDERPLRLRIHCGLSVPLEFRDRFWLPIDPALRQT